ncbi:hypothetical protein [Burkholderia cenocepacia]|uniref:hypothetical protein n=1 Tax=Burkholderia cenocepacia TaxID=95486 RepID=UPI0007618478|nr:hypothetical protein [Burkholderia cenocepacia]KWU17958.1 hypothetical protein AS149_14890 [Burkholderia cenocepacia]
MSKDFVAFSNDTDVLNIRGDDLTITNGLAHVQVSGTLDIGKDKAGLEAALALQRAVNSVVAVLTAETALPKHVKDEPAEPTGSVENPFS